jgi:predicted KAP-like P-loop ATPase
MLLFKKGSMLKKNERWTVHDQLIEAVDEINYLGVTLDSTARWKK